MKISYNWLKSYIKTELSPEETSKILTDTGLEIEAIEKYESIPGGLEGLVIGEVLTCEKHPDADRLSITTVDVGSGENLNIVCGAPNVSAGQKVVVAKVGTTLYPKNGESFQIKKSKIRGTVSEGMICAEDEIGLGKSHEGIMILNPEAKTGMPAAEYFNIENDYIFEIGLTPNRADAASHIGVARDLAAAITVNLKQNTKIEFPPIDNFSIKEKEGNISVNVQNTEACPRYSGVLIKGIQIGPSPEWLQDRLKSIGLKPINNIVDITNFVLHETGQPLHAFDADKIEGSRVIVRNASEGEKFVTLDDVERTLKPNNLLICNEKEPMGIAGVFGGKKSGVTVETKSIFLESAYFNPVSIRKTAKDHGLKTDASFRYERGADPNITIYALKRAALLMEEVAGGKIASEIIDVYPQRIQPFKVEFTYSNCDRLIGKTIDREVIKLILTSLEIKIQEETSWGLILEVPAFKVDVTREVDVIEEILRIYGYNKIQLPGQMRTSLIVAPKPHKDKIRNVISDFLSSNGFNEIMCNSLTKAEYSEGSQYFSEKENVKILNPLSNDLNVLRRTLLFGGLEAIVYNQNRKNPDLKLFEFGKSYSKINDKYIEENYLALFITGKKQPENWNTPNDKTSIYFLKGMIEAIFTKAGIEFKNDKETDLNYLSYGLSFTSRKRNIADLGLINKRILKKFDISQDVFYAEIKWDYLLELQKNRTISYKEVPKFPSVRRDLALVLDKNKKFSELVDISWQTEKHLLKDVGIFDIYEGDKIEQDKKSYAVSFIFQHPEQTLTDQQVDKSIEKLLKSFESRLGAKLR